jgi:limonene-1,2-epoxide hydrolase
MNQFIAFKRSKPMITRIIATFIMLITLATLNVSSAQASVEPIVTVDSFFAALNTGDHKAAVAAFTPDATARLARGETYGGQAEIADLVQLMEHPGRHYEIVQVRMVGDTVSFMVEVSDQGVRWGEATIVAEVRAGKLHTFHETAFNVRLGS